MGGGRLFAYRMCARLLLRGVGRLGRVRSILEPLSSSSKPSSKPKEKPVLPRLGERIPVRGWGGGVGVGWGFGWVCGCGVWFWGGCWVFWVCVLGFLTEIE